MDRVNSLPFNRKSGTVGRRARILACGPLEITKSLHKTFNARFSEKAASFDTLNVTNLHGLGRGWSRLLLSVNTAFILVFNTDDEESFQAISNFRNAIEGSKGEDVPLLVVGYNRKTSAPRIMGPETADCLVTIEWGFSYAEVSEGKQEEIDSVLLEILKVVREKNNTTFGRLVTNRDI